VSRRNSKKREKRRRAQRRRTAEETLSRRVKSQFGNQEVTIVPPHDGVKMSKVLERFVEPYQKFAETEDAYRKLLAMALIAWNTALFPKRERSTSIKEVLVAMPEDLRDDGNQIIQDLMARKDKFFSQYRRMILDYELVDTGGSLHLSVVSTITRKPHRHGG